MNTVYPVSSSSSEPVERAPNEVFAAAERANRHTERRLRAYWIIGFGAVGFLVVLVATGIFIEQGSFYAPVAALNERLAAEGSPTTWEAAQAATPHPPTELDGTAEWLSFLKKNGRTGEYDPLDPKTSDAKAAGWIAELRALAASGRFRVARYPMAVLRKDDYMVVLRDLSAETSVARFLIAQSRERRESDDADGAADSLALALAPIANAKYEPFLVCRLSGSSQLGYAMDGIEPLIVEGNLSSERLAQLQSALERCDVASNLDSMRLHELLIQRDYATSGRLSDYDVNPVERWIARRVFVRQLELVDRTRRAQGLEVRERLVELAEIDEAYARQQEEEASFTTTGIASIVHHEFRSDNVPHELTITENENRRRALVAALACRRFEIDRNELPSEWADLAGFDIAEPPLNLWTGARMTLHRADDGSVSIEASWVEEAIVALGSRQSGESPPEPFDGLTLSPRSE